MEDFGGNIITIRINRSVFFSNFPSFLSSEILSRVGDLVGDSKVFDLL